MNYSKRPDLFVLLETQRQARAGITYSSAIQAEYVRVAMAAGQTRNQAIAPFADAVGYSRYGKTNLLLWSEDFSNSSWVKSGGVGALPQVITFNPSLDSDVRQNYTLDIAIGEKYTFSFEYRADTTFNFFALIFRNFLTGGGPYEETKINLTTSSDWQTVEATLTFANFQKAVGVGFFQRLADTGRGGTLEVRNIRLNKSATALPYVKTTDEQVIPNIFNEGTNDATRGANSGVASDDPAIISEGLSFDGVDDRFGGIPAKPATYTELYVDDANVHIIDSAGGAYTDNVASAVTSPDLSTGGGYSGVLKEYYRFNGVVLDSSQRGYWQTALSNLGII